MIRRLWPSVIVAVVAALALPGGAQQAPAPGGELAKALAVIRTSPVPADIADAYRDARAKNPASIELHRAYMLRMLKYGVIPPAQGAAERLVALDPADGLAWAVLAYSHGKAGRYAKALDSALHAAASESENPSVQAALGQLLAWRENAPEAADLPAATKAALDAARDKLNARAPFASAHAALAKVYTDVADHRKRLEDRLAAHRADMQALEHDFAALGKQLDDIDREIGVLQGRIARTRREMYSLTHQATSTPPPPKPGSPPTPPTYKPLTADERTLCDSYQQSIQADEAALRDLNAKHDLVIRQRTDLRAKAKKMTETLNTLSAELKSVADGIAKRFRWDPPAVEGVVTPARDLFPSASPPSAATGPAPASPQPGERELKLAQLHLDNGRTDLARAKLESLIAQFPDTPAAAKARQILDSIKGQ